MLKAAELLGFTPASRTRVQVVDSGGSGTYNKWAAIGPRQVT